MSKGLDGAMRICHVTCVHPRNDIRILEKECVSLAKAGYEVFLVVNDTEADEFYKGVQIVSTGYVAKNRIERITRSTGKALNKAMEINADVYHLHDPELLRIAGALIKKGKKVIFDAHEDTEEQIKDKTWIPIMLRSLLSKVYGFYSYRIMSHLNGIITVTPSLVEKFKRYHPNVALVTNYPILANNEKKDDLNEKRFENEKFVFFAGGVSEQWCHESIAEAVSQIEGVKYLIAGRGEKEFVAKICELGAEYLGIIPHEEVIQYYHKSIAGMALLKCTQVGTEGTLGNTKLFEVMQAGKPVICSNLKLWREIVEENNCGLCVDPDSVFSVASAIKYLISHPGEARKMGENGKRAVSEQFNWGMQEKVLEDFYRGLQNEHTEM